jgi:hypothetical protein
MMAQTSLGHPVAAIPLVRQWQNFTDPNEGAFRVQMPVGWRNTGGLKRYSALQYRAWTTSVSPDGLTILALGDATEPAYTTPMMGFRPGSIYSATGTYYIVEPLQSGQQYAVSWGERKLRNVCTNVRVTGSRARPDVGRQMAAFAITHDYGEATFTCSRDGIDLTAYAFLGITLIRTTAYTTLWYADSMMAFVSPTPVAGVAAGLVAHMLKSMAPNPAWVARQSRTASDVSQIASQANNTISNDIMQGWEQRGAAMDRIMEEGSRARLGIDVYSDPATGTQYTVANTSQEYWVNAAGSVVGTQTNSSPGPGYAKLTRVPPQ